eukprot:8814100-Prorocentrum_lima.AAC.1
MTSSLVGSEMCIRDRCCWAGSLQGPSPTHPAPRAPPSPPLLCGGGGIRPVSYTHLTLPTICSV